MGSLGDLLATRRRRYFVGRDAEQELFRAALAAAEAPFAVLYLHGPAGIGKTGLLDVFAALAEDAGARVVRLNGRDIDPSPSSLLATLGASVHVPHGDARISSSERLVVLVDSYERLAPADDWLRTRLLPRFPADALTVVAGRTPPAPAWRADAGWTICSASSRSVTLIPRTVAPTSRRIMCRRPSTIGCSSCRTVIPLPCRCWRM